MVDLPNFPDHLIKDWLELARAATKFRETVRIHQLNCRHSHVVQYNPSYSSFRKPESQHKPKKVCVSCGLVESATIALNPESFSELDATNGAEIIEFFEQVDRFNHYLLPWSVELTRETGNGTRFEITCDAVATLAKAAPSRKSGLLFAG